MNLNFGPNIENVAKVFDDGALMTTIKWMYVVGMSLYILFSIIMLKQTMVMSETIDGKYNSGVKTFAWVNLITAIMLIIAAVIIL